MLKYGKFLELTRKTFCLAFQANVTIVLMKVLGHISDFQALVSLFQIIARYLKQKLRRIQIPIVALFSSVTFFIIQIDIRGRN